VENVNWFEARDSGRRLDLVLPTEIEWEYACRAGTSTPFFWGENASSLENHENCADSSLKAILDGIEGTAPWNDRFPMHAPVGSFTQNAFGLFDMHGNVSEWCENEFDASTDGEPRTSQSTVTQESKLQRVARGGSWYVSPLFQRSAFRQDLAPTNCNVALGVRFAKHITAQPASLR
jgi:formylglycine-generating enzyme required for sulfatase activity